MVRERDKRVGRAICSIRKKLALDSTCSGRGISSNAQNGP